MHPSEELKGRKSNKLTGKTIVLGVTGSIAATECVELIRHGARVVPVMSESARRIIHEDALEYATGEKPVTSLTGKVEHVYHCGEVPDRADLYLIAPATANTIGKIANGIDDTPVTTFATTALGSRIPIMVVPAMHSSMYRHPVVIENIEKLKKLGLEFVSPRIEEMRVKWPGYEIITAEVIRKIGKRDLDGKRILIISGPTREPIDEVRAITNKSTGRTGIELACEAYMRSANVEIWYGISGEKPPQYIASTPFEKVSDLVTMVENMPNYDVIVNCAAISDFTL
ncbi:MAG: bifunctional phosphopantothenoylcysteine decarboxylase/phosphopantothenate--cysteine ligase CoaBC, partial [Thermoplasmata archaeon]